MFSKKPSLMWLILLALGCGGFGLQLNKKAAPHARFTSSITGGAAQLDASGSRVFDGQNDLAQYEWTFAIGGDEGDSKVGYTVKGDITGGGQTINFDDGSYLIVSGDIQNPTLLFVDPSNPARADVIRACLKVKDSQGKISQSPKPNGVACENLSLTANNDVPQAKTTSVTSGTSTTFDATSSVPGPSSTSTNSADLQYRWEFFFDQAGPQYLVGPDASVFSVFGTDLSSSNNFTVANQSVVVSGTIQQPILTYPANFTSQVRACLFVKDPSTNKVNPVGTCSTENVSTSSVGAPFTVGGSISGIPFGKSVTITDGISVQTVTVNADGTFTFSNPINGGSALNVTAANPKNAAGTSDANYTCAVTGGTTVVSGNTTSIVVTCSCGAGQTTYNQVGAGTVVSPYQIFTPAQFKDLGDNGSADWTGTYYTQMCDLNLQGLTLASVGNSTTPFGGSYDGQYYQIHNASISKVGGLVGLFRMQSASMSHVVYRNSTANIAGTTGFEWSGALISEAITSTISDMYVDNITMSDASGVASSSEGIGALVGNLDGGTLTRVSVQNSTISAPTSGGNMGAVIGINSPTGFRPAAIVSEIESINNDLTTNVSAAGIAGEAYGTTMSDLAVLNLDVKANIEPAGVLGNALVKGATGNTIQRAYSSGNISSIGVTATFESAGIVASNEDLVVGTNIVNSFTTMSINLAPGSGSTGRIKSIAHDIVTNSAFLSSATLSPAGDTAGTSLASDATFIDGTANAMSSWDFTNTWCLISGSYPRLRNVPFSACN